MPMKAYRIIAAAALMLFTGSLWYAQLGNLRNLAGKAKQAADKAASSSSSAAATTPAAKGKTFYVSVSTGSARADGLSPTTAMKDLQKAIDTAEENDVILVAEGNYLGNMDRGYVESGRFGNAQN